MDRLELIKNLKGKGFKGKLLDSFSKVSREKFVPYQLRGKAYDDTALPIGHGQTISQPYTIAIMLSQLNLKVGYNVLEIGSGSGYVLALTSEIVGQKGKVFGIELIPELTEKSKINLKQYSNVSVYNLNGAKGLLDKAPFDGIIISAAIHEIPEMLMDQLKVGGILVAPKGSRFEQELIVIKRIAKTEFEILKKIPGFIFVPFIEED